MILRPFQGGYTYRKFLYWVKSSNRFRFRLIIFFCIFGYPIRDNIWNYLGGFAYFSFYSFVHLFRPPGAEFSKHPLQLMHPQNLISELPPNPKVIKKSFDEKNAYKLYVENEKFLRFKVFNEVDIVRTRCFFAHPSRETNGVVEGEILRNEQDKIVESMNIMMAEFGVKKGIWKDLKEAFRQGDEIKRKRLREEFKRLAN